MTGVKHMKWWGWGLEGVAFHHEDKPAFGPFVSDKVGLDITGDPVVPPVLESLPPNSSLRSVGGRVRGPSASRCCCSR